MAGFLSLTDSKFPATRHCDVPRCIARNLFLSSNVRIKRARHMPEISILHHVCDRWNMRLIIEIRRCDASLPTIADCRSLGSPAKFDGVYMAFELAFPRSDMSAAGDYRYTLPLRHISVFRAVVRSAVGIPRRVERCGLHLRVREVAERSVGSRRASGRLRIQQTFKTALRIMRKSCGDGPARQGAGLLSLPDRKWANIQCPRGLGGSNPPPRASSSAKTCEVRRLVEWKVSTTLSSEESLGGDINRRK